VTRLRIAYADALADAQRDVIRPLGLAGVVALAKLLLAAGGGGGSSAAMVERVPQAASIAAICLREIATPAHSATMSAELAAELLAIVASTIASRCGSRGTADTAEENLLAAAGLVADACLLRLAQWAAAHSPQSRRRGDEHVAVTCNRALSSVGLLLQAGFYANRGSKKNKPAGSHAFVDAARSASRDATLDLSAASDAWHSAGGGAAVRVKLLPVRGVVTDVLGVYAASIRGGSDDGSVAGAELSHEHREMAVEGLRGAGLLSPAAQLILEGSASLHGRRLPQKHLAGRGRQQREVSPALKHFAGVL
jgi:hypothetical protein